MKKTELIELIKSIDNLQYIRYGKMAGENCRFSKEEDLINYLSSKISFEKKDLCHDWRNYIPEPLYGIWDKLTIETKIIAFFMAEAQADREEWD